MSTAKGRVLVSGGAGFIGSWLCRRLLDDGYRVVCLDNLSTGSRENLRGLDVDLIQADVTGPVDVKADYIFDLASRASPVDFETHPIDILLTNSRGAQNMLEMARKSSARFLFSSTSEVYGDPLQHPQREDYFGNVNPVGIRSCYDESKRFAEAMTMAFHRTHGTDVRLARIFNTYGERMRPEDGRVVPNLVGQAIAGQPMTVYGDGSQTRSFCYVSDMVEGLVRLMFKDGIAGTVVNLGNPHEVTVLEIARVIKKLTGSKSEIVHRPLPPDDPVRRRPDISRARELLGWQPLVGLEEGLGRTIEYFRQR
ncbi:MAG: SDR family oxidoreductase [Chloroflexi bacterium]|nr:SDR family oxidoreductase [Chloroflexota bacterium]